MTVKIPTLIDTTATNPSPADQNKATGTKSLNSLARLHNAFFTVSGTTYSATDSDQETPMIQDLYDDVAQNTTDIATAQTNITGLQNDVNDLQSNKIDKVTSAGVGNAAVFDANGNIVDSGIVPGGGSSDNRLNYTVKSLGHAEIYTNLSWNYKLPEIKPFYFRIGKNSGFVDYNNSNQLGYQLSIIKYRPVIAITASRADYPPTFPTRLPTPASQGLGSEYYVKSPSTGNDANTGDITSWVNQALQFKYDGTDTPAYIETVISNCEQITQNKDAYIFKDAAHTIPYSSMSSAEQANVNLILSLDYRANIRNYQNMNCYARKDNLNSNTSGVDILADLFLVKIGSKYRIVATHSHDPGEYHKKYGSGDFYNAFDGNPDYDSLRWTIGYNNTIVYVKLDSLDNKILPFSSKFVKSYDLDKILRDPNNFIFGDADATITYTQMQSLPAYVEPIKQIVKLIDIWNEAFEALPSNYEMIGCIGFNLISDGIFKGKRVLDNGQISFSDYPIYSDNGVYPRYNPSAGDGYLFLTSTSTTTQYFYSTVVFDNGSSSGSTIYKKLYFGRNRAYFSFNIFSYDNMNNTAPDNSFCSLRIGQTEVLSRNYNPSVPSKSYMNIPKVPMYDYANTLMFQFTRSYNTSTTFYTYITDIFSSYQEI